MRAVPGSRRTTVVGRYGDGWKIRVVAAPERGRANDELCRYLAGLLGVHRSSVSIVAGAGARDKLVEVLGLSAEDCASRLEAAAT